MLRTLDRAKAIAEMDTRRRNPSKFLRRTESQLMREALARILALDVLREVQGPACDMMKALRDIEFQAGQFVGAALSEAHREPRSIDLQGALTGVVAFLNMRPRLLPPKIARFSFQELTLRKIALSAVDFVLPDKNKKEDDLDLSPRSSIEFEDDLQDGLVDFSTPFPSEVKKKRKAKSKSKAKGKKRVTKRKAARRKA